MARCLMIWKLAQMSCRKRYVCETIDAGWYEWTLIHMQNDRKGGPTMHKQVIFHEEGHAHLVDTHSKWDTEILMGYGEI
jgi:hypothetical protein